MKTDIQNKADIKLLIESFYGKARIDPLLGPVFAAAVKDDEWPHHIETITTFWNSVLFMVPGYRGGAFRKHAPLPIEKRHFD